MAQINVTASLGTNTGRVNGDIRMGRIKGILLHRGAIPFTSSELADPTSLFAAIQAKMNKKRDDPDKMFLIDGFREAEDKTGDPQTGNLQDGYEEVLNEALPKFVFKHTKGVAENQSLVLFNGWTNPIFFIDDKGVFWYKGAANNGGQGFSVGYFFASAPKPGGSGAINTGLINVSLGSADEFKSNVGALKIDWTTAQLTNPVDLTLAEAAVGTANTIKIGVTNRFAGTSVYGALKAGLSQSGAWKVTKASDGSAVTVSAVAAVDATSSFTLTTTGTTAGDKLIVELQSAATLAGLTTPVVGVESVPLKVTAA